MRDISVFDLGWLVGIVEGEGTFSVNKTRRSTTPRFYLYSPDEWVVDRCLQVTGMGRKYVRPEGKGNRPGNGHRYGWVVSKIKDVETLYAEIQPHLSPRLRERLLETLKIMES